MLVVDIRRREPIAIVPLDGISANNVGIAYKDPNLGQVWATSSMASAKLAVVGTDPAAGPKSAWRLLRTYDLPSGGSLFAATHEASDHIWIDMPLSANPIASQGVAAVSKSDPEEPAHMLPDCGLGGACGTGREGAATGVQ